MRRGLGGDSATANPAKYNPYPEFSIGATYQQGQVIEIEVELATHHLGYFQVSVCNTAELADENMVTQECLNRHILHRDDSDLRMPIDPDHPERAFLWPRCDDHPSYRDAPRGEYGKIMQANFKLPDDLSCTHCVFQFHYVTANGCFPPGTPA